MLSCGCTGGPGRQAGRDSGADSLLQNPEHQNTNPESRIGRPLKRIPMRMGRGRQMPEQMLHSQQCRRVPLNSSLCLWWPWWPCGHLPWRQYPPPQHGGGISTHPCWPDRYRAAADAPAGASGENCRGCTGACGGGWSAGAEFRAVFCFIHFLLAIDVGATVLSFVYSSPVGGCSSSE